MDDDQEQAPSIDDLVAILRARVEERRQQGVYPPGLDDALGAHFRRIVSQREDTSFTDPTRAIEEVSWLRFQPVSVASDSRFPAGELVHRTIARLVARHTQDVLEQMQEFVGPVVSALQALAAAVSEVRRDVHVEMAHHIDALYENLAAYERASIDPLNSLLDLEDRVARIEAGVGVDSFDPWYSAERFDEEFRGSQAEILERYRDLATRLTGHDPVLDFGCGRGEFLTLLSELGIESGGVELDTDLVKACTERGLTVEHGDGLRTLANLSDGSLGGLVLIQVVEHLSPQHVVDLVALAAQKVRPGGRVLVETVNPQSLYVYAHAFYLDPTHLRLVHPSYLSFLFREAGFRQVEIDWRSPPPSRDVLEEFSGGGELEPKLNANIRRLNELLFAPQDYLVAAVR